MVTIHNLDVRMSVEGGGSREEEAFVKLFNKYIKLWSEQDAKQKNRSRRVAHERSLGDRREGGEGES
jgi:hypothetical protein